MLKRVCDICNHNKGNNKYKVKQLKDVVEFDDHGYMRPVSKWVEIDICDECIELIRASRKSGLSLYIKRKALESFCDANCQGCDACPIDAAYPDHSCGNGYGYLPVCDGDELLVGDAEVNRIYDYLVIKKEKDV